MNPRNLPTILAALLLAAVDTVKAQTGRGIAPVIKGDETLPTYYMCDAWVRGRTLQGGIMVNVNSKGFCVMLCPLGIDGPEPKYLIPNAEHAVRFAAIFQSFLERNAGTAHNPTLWYSAAKYGILHMQREYPGFVISGVEGTGALVQSAELSAKATR